MQTKRLVDSRSLNRVQRRLHAVQRARSALMLLGLVVLPFCLFWQEALGRRIFYQHDLQYYFYPYHKVVADITASGHLPLWNPYAFSGIPLLGDGQTAMLYPPNWLFWILPAAHALMLSIVLHFSLAGLGMFLYLRRLHLGRTATLIGSLTFMLNGFLTARIVHPSIMAGAALIPLVFWAFEGVLQHGDARSHIIAAASVALQTVAGHPQIPLYTAVGLAAYALAIAWQRWLSARRLQELRPLAQLLAVYLLAYALAAAQLLPWIELAGFSPRAAEASFKFVTEHSLRGFDWLLMLFPYGFGGARSSWLQTLPPWELPVYVWERLGYIGLPPLALAGVGLAELYRLPHHARQERGRPAGQRSALQGQRLWGLALLLALMLLIAGGSSSPAGELIYAVPVLGKLRAYSRAMGVACFALAAFAAYGAQRLRGWRAGAAGARDPAAIVAALLLSLAVSGALLYASQTTQDDPLPEVETMFNRALAIERANAYVPLALALVTALLLYRASWGLTTRLAGMSIALVVLDLASVAVSFYPTIDSAIMSRVPPSAQFLRQVREPYRIAVFLRNDRMQPEIAQAQLAISWALAYGIEDINGFNSLQPRRYTDFLFGEEVEDVSYGFLHDRQLLQPDNPLLAMLDVRYVMVQPQAPVEVPPSWRQVYADQHVRIYAYPRRLGRAYFVDQVTVERDARRILQTLKTPGFQPRRRAFVESGMQPARAAQLTHSGPADVQVERRSPNEVQIRTRTDAERFLVVSEMWFPGWHAEIDGVEVPLYRTNYLFQGLIVPAGSHTIRLTYRPASALLGATLTGLAFVACLLILKRQRTSLPLALTTQPSYLRRTLRRRRERDTGVELD